MQLTEKLREPTYIQQLKQQAMRVTDQVTLTHSPHKLWPYISNTDMINSKIGLSPAQYSFTKNDQGDTHMHVEVREAGMKIAYEEFPYEWHAQNGMQVERVYKTGPISYMRFESALEATPDGGATATVTIDFVPKFAGFLIQKLFIETNLKKILDVYKEIDQKITSNQLIRMQAFLDPPSTHQTEITSLYEQWKHLASDSYISQKIAEFIYTAPDQYVKKMRPFEIAPLYELDRLETLKFFLRATKTGFLNLSWDLLCPSCLGPKEGASTLNDVNPEAHCDACGIDYGINFDENIELTFQPVKKVKQVESFAFCAGGPANTAHIVSQLNVWPGEVKKNTLNLDPGSYRFRSLSMSGQQEFDVLQEEGSQTVALELSCEFPEERTLKLSSPFELTLNNQQPYMQTIKVEHLVWKENTVTAAFVSTLQEFRDMFSSEVLRPGVQLALSNVTIVFTDLKDSTKIYDTHGDASAFNLVQAHFDLMLPIIDQHQGALVKTIGDAVMAVFHNTMEAMSACAAIQQAFGEWNASRTDGKQAIVKIGFHTGPCLALNLNNTLDYFGATVNKAARVQGESVGNDICLTQEVYQEADIQALITKNGYLVEPFEKDLKGISARGILYRLTVGSSGEWLSMRK